MSFVLDQVRRIDALLDRVQLEHISSADESARAVVAVDTKTPPARLAALQAAIRSLSTAGGSDRNALLPPKRILGLLNTLSTSLEGEGEGEGFQGRGVPASGSDAYTTELEWLLAAKATTHVYGAVIDALLTGAVRLADDMWYWDEVLGSRRHTVLYGVQTAPSRLWGWTNEVWADVRARSGGDDDDNNGSNMLFRVRDARDTVGQSWREFYALVRQVVRERGLGEEARGRVAVVLGPVARIRVGVERKRKVLERLRLRHANALGVLLGEGLANESVHGEGVSSPTAGAPDVRRKWKASVARTVALVEAVLAKVDDLDTPVDGFDAAIAELTDDDPLYGGEVDEDGGGGEGGAVGSVTPRAVAGRLSRVLTLALPQHAASTRSLMAEHGRPSRAVRYWLPVAVALLSSTTVLRILVRRRAELVQWVRESGATIVDFWANWVVEPTRRVIQTIRHDTGSEVAIMSKRSLAGDRASLERMVVDFAVDNSVDATGAPARLDDAAIAEIRTRVGEGDLTPVLKAYERDLTSPFMGAVRGNLVRALLIQIQKTKVDVEVAIGGIDALLKSQELAFGLLGLTPGLLVTYFGLRYVRSTLRERGTPSSANPSSSSSSSSSPLLRQLRAIDRVLVDSTPTTFGELPYRDQGLLLCEAHTLRRAAAATMPARVYAEFRAEVDRLCDVRVGRERQRLVAERIRWGFGRWVV